MKLDILVFSAHPDDAELACGGTIIKHVKKGLKVGIIDLTKGELGTRGNFTIREQEAQRASKILGLSIRENMNFKDGFFKDDDDHCIAIIKKIRKYKPSIVLTNAPKDRHPDHGRSSNITTKACFLSGLEKIDTNQDVWRPDSIYFYIQFNNLSPDFVVDISKYIDHKMNSIKAYKSQFYNPNSNESETLISKKDFLDSVIYRSADLGRLTNCKYAEGFLSHQLNRIEYLNNFNKRIE